MNSEKFNDLKIEKLTFRFNQNEKEVSMDIPIAGGTATLTSTNRTTSNYEVKMTLNGEKKFSFKINKSICDIGSNSNSTYYKLLSGNMERNAITPDYEGDGFKEKFKNLTFEMQTANGDVSEILNTKEWQTKSQEEKKISWAEDSGAIEKFTKENKHDGIEILKNGNLIEEMIDLAELKAAGQRNNIALVVLLDLSTFLKDSIHHISTGPPGTSKSTITDTIFEMFPNNRKESIGKSSTPASLLNMTTYLEGSEVLSRKLIRLGDLGNEEEIKATLPLLSIIKEMMSEKKYDKTISVPEGDSHTTKRLTLKGIGSVQLSTVESKVESQYDSRAIISSPDDNEETFEKVKDHQLDDLEKQLKNKQFAKRRPAVAVAIDKVCSIVEFLERKHGDVEIINPYAPHMNEIFKIDESKNTYRNRNHIRDLPKSVTLANIVNRKIWIHKVDNDAKFIISPEEYLESLKIIQTSILKMLSNMSTQQQSYIRYIEMNYLNDDIIILKEYEEHHQDNQEHIGDKDENETCWSKKIKEEVCFTKIDIADGLGVSPSTANRVLEDLIKQELIYKKLYQKKNYYFPTKELLCYSKNSVPTIFTDEDLEKGGEVHQIAEKIYAETVERLKAADYEENPSPFNSHSGK